MRSIGNTPSRAFTLVRFAALSLALGAAAPVLAQAPATPPASPAAPSSPATPAPAPAPEAPATPGAPAATPEASAVKIIEIAARPALVFAGQAAWEDSYTSLNNAFERLRAEMTRAGLKTGGRPVAVFVSTDDAGFRFEAMIPLAEAPATAPQLGAEFKVGETPAGRAVKFEHRGAYEEIDATYEAITAWLDDKSLESRDFFVEEYLKDAKGADDTDLEVDVYVFVK